MILGIVPQAYFDAHSEQVLESEDRIICSGLTHYASHLLQKCFCDMDELERSMQRAITALRAAHIPPSQHFRTVFLCGSELKCDWLISDLGLRLLLINADVSNPQVGRLQVEILMDGFEPLDHD